MKRTVYNTMIGLMLACGLTMTSTGAMAQGRRPATNSNAAAAGNRSVATASPKSNAVVTNNNSTSRASMGSPVNRTSTSSQVVNRPSTSSSTATTTTSRPQAGNRSSVSTSISNSTSNSNIRTINGSGNSGSSLRPSTGGNNGTGHSGSNNGGTVRPNTGGNNGGHSGNNGGTVRPNTGGNNGSSVRPNTGGNNGKGHSTPPTSRPTTNNPRPKVGGTVMAGGGPKIDYSAFRYNHTHRPRFDGDRFFNSFRYNSWSWTNPIRPSVRQWRPSTMWIYRPIVTVNVTRYSTYPTIAGVLGLSWGTSFHNTLNYLYYNGYYIDGYMDNIVYLTDVELLDFDWDDVMLQFDGNDNLDYVEFAYWTSSYDTSRFFSLYNYLCSMYGSPVSYANSMYSWYGGDGIGFVNLGYQTGNDVFYTVLAFGI
ncbi:MAG: hypothetical protein IJP59_12145 [Muribaculaceae bacterium]|nr:hypothetical protein [Muribaculaceae bacterium]